MVYKAGQSEREVNTLQAEELLKELQGNQSLREFAKITGISKSMLHEALAGDKQLGRDSIDKLLTAYPGQRAKILGVFFLVETVHNSGVESANAEATP